MRSGVASRPPCHGTHSRAEFSSRRRSSPSRRAMRRPIGAMTSTGSSAAATGAPRTVAAEDPVITASAGRNSVAPRHRTTWVTRVYRST